MKRTIPALVIGVISSLLFAACDAPEPRPRTVSEQRQAFVGVDNCTGTEQPPHVTPTYARPATDNVALESLLEASGYGALDDRDWVDVAAGNFCGGDEKELVLLKNQHSTFSIMRGPTPYAVGSGDPSFDTAHPWRAVAAGKLDASGFDSMVAVRHVTASGVPDVIVTKADPSSCAVSTVRSAVVGNPGNSDWSDAAIGNFTGSGNQIALLKSAHVRLIVLDPTTLQSTVNSDLNAPDDLPWQKMAAGDLDHDGLDELVFARTASDNLSSTVAVFKWNAAIGNFAQLASTTIGNNGNSKWVGLAVGDFNGDGRASIALLKADHTNFIVASLTTNNTLNVLPGQDLDTVAGEDWRGVAAVDWLGGDQGAAELIAIRHTKNTAISTAHLADLFVYGSSFHRVARDSALADTKSLDDQLYRSAATFDPTTGITSDNDALIDRLFAAHANAVLWNLTYFDDYRSLVAFLDRSKNLCVDGRRVRVWANLLPPWKKRARHIDVLGDLGLSTDLCSHLEESTLTPWADLDPYATDPDDACPAKCTGYLALASGLGRLAQQYPQLVAVGMDDFSQDPDQLTEPAPGESCSSTSRARGETIAQMESLMRQQAPWLSFVPTVYYSHFLNGKWPDFTRMVDAPLFFYRNDSTGQTCITDPCQANLPSETAVMAARLPVGRSLQLGVYFTPLSYLPDAPPTPTYEYDVVHEGIAQPRVEGVTVYTTDHVTPPPAGVTCDRFNAKTYALCGLAQNWGSTSCTPGETQPCGNCGTQSCTAGFTWGACSGEGVCSPGSTSSSACGTMCGTRVDTCSATCQWVVGTCGNEGVCTPGATQTCCACPGGCGHCQGDQVCRSDCSWGTCNGSTCLPLSCR